MEGKKAKRALEDFLKEREGVREKMRKYRKGKSEGRKVREGRAHLFGVLTV